VRSHELTTGRTFGIVFDHHDDFFGTLTAFCAANNVRQGYIPMFIAGFAEAEIVGTCEKLADPGAPVWSKVHLANVEPSVAAPSAMTPTPAMCCPTFTLASGSRDTQPAATPAITSGARVQFLVEMLLVEVITPTMLRTREPARYDVPLLRFSS
jgi:hypothetical protein